MDSFTCLHSLLYILPQFCRIMFSSSEYTFRCCFRRPFEVRNYDQNPPELSPTKTIALICIILQNNRYVVIFLCHLTKA